MTFDAPPAFRVTVPGHTTGGCQPQQGHRRSVEPCSWFLRNFVGIVAVMIFVVGILVNYDTIVGNDEKAGGTG